jgi:Zn-dependent protease
LHSQVKLGRIAGISIGLHYSWFIIAALIIFSLVDHFQRIHPYWDTTVVWSVAGVTGLLFFATLLLHELAHSVVAQARGIRVRAITLFALGGMSQIESDASDAASEFWIAVAGPLTSVILGFCFVFAARAAGWRPGSEPSTPAIAVLLWLGYINLTLATFNMIPGYPLDGGRVTCHRLVDHERP